MSHIYFARSLRGDRTANDKDTYKAIASAIKACGHRLSMDLNPIPRQPDWTWESFVFARDIAWLRQSAALIAEVTNVSHGVGYEICYANEVLMIPILCLAVKDTKVSAMIGGADENVTLAHYRDFSHMKSFIKTFLAEVK